MKTPTLPQCYALFDEYHVPGTIRTHCNAVFQVTSFLAEKLVESEYPLKVEIVKPFALLHDFMKAVVLERLTDPPYNYTPTAAEAAMHQRLRTQYAGKSETFAAYSILNQEYPEFAALFLELDELIRNPNATVSEETKFIHYVDWRVLGNKIVPLKERIEYIFQKYGKWITQKNIDWKTVQQEQFDYEQQIFKHLAFTPEELAQQVSL